MTVDKRLTDALKPFGDDIGNAVGFSKNKRYYAFNYTTLPIAFADNEPHYERYLVQVHFFAPLAENITKRKKETKAALFRAGFTWPTAEDASDSDGRHIIFECEIEEGIDDDGEV